MLGSRPEFRKPGVTVLLMMGCNCEQILNLPSAREREAGDPDPIKAPDIEKWTDGKPHWSCQQLEDTQAQAGDMTLASLS